MNKFVALLFEYCYFYVGITFTHFSVPPREFEKRKVFTHIIPDSIEHKYRKYNPIRAACLNVFKAIRTNAVSFKIIFQITVLFARKFSHPGLIGLA